MSAPSPLAYSAQPIATAIAPRTSRGSAECRGEARNVARAPIIERSLALRRQSCRNRCARNVADDAPIGVDTSELADAVLEEQRCDTTQVVIGLDRKAVRNDGFVGPDDHHFAHANQAQPLQRPVAADEARDER